MERRETKIAPLTMWMTDCFPLVQRKRRIISRVRCKNIKNDCPKPTCEDPVLLPQRCCKTCPGEDYADLEEDIAARKLEAEDEDKVLREFTVLLTGKLLVPTVPVSGAARGYLVYTKRDLHYTIHYRGISRPILVRFTNEEGNILEEHAVTYSPHHIQGSKVCGVWRKVPKIYRRLLQKDRILFVLVTADYPDGVVGGRIMKHEPINTEAFGALLLPDLKSSDEILGSGGMADIFPVTDSIHVSLGFNGIFTSKDARDVPIVVSLLYEDSSGRMQPVSETQVTLAKAHPDYNSATVKLDLSPQLQERLSSAKFELRLSSKDGQRQQSGRITPKVTCNVFQAVMTSTEVTDISKDPVTGFIVLDIGLDGFINYKLHVSDANIESVNIALETDVGTPSGTSIRQLQHITQNLTDSWGNGSFSRRSGPEVEMLLTDDLVVTVTAETLKHPFTSLPASAYIHGTGHPVQRRSRTTRSDKVHTLLRGSVRQGLYTEALLNEIPLLLSGGNTTAGGIAWLSIDKDCVLHYQVYLSGLDPKERHLLELLQVRPGKYSHPLQRVLKRFEGDQVMVEDLADDLDGRSLAFLQAGYTYLVVTSKLAGKAKAVQLRAKITELAAPVSCLPRYDVSSMQRNGHTYQDGYNDVYGADSGHKCIYEDSLFEDGAQWKAEHEECTMCSCQRSRVVCERMICPDPVCDNPMTIPGECCPFCPGNNTTSLEVNSHRSPGLCYFEADKKYHVAGSRWHPYVPPFGFSRCSLCTCEAKTLNVKCERITCPPLTCAEKESYRDHPRACCKKCPNSVAVKSHILGPPSLGQLGDQSGEKLTAKEILASGGCKFRGQLYHNGDEWHPTIEPYGAEKCVKCHCKDSRAKCKRKKCPKETCPVKVPGEDGCCEHCIDTVSDSSSRSTEGPGKGKKRRKDRERRHRKIRQPKEKQ
ncbi:dorsal-ventral patterning protein Sog-like [Uloborus diversus]|uniref:dorsal-ventral patterning protein Sog-like n=1 Tax=Uloborus diversus TaxID=327109 RepID=UPI00240A98B8|nr:dorsal-ventral patterning protein Sog-like [Uloborus diversus]